MLRQHWKANTEHYKIRESRLYILINLGPSVSEATCANVCSGNRSFATICWNSSLRARDSKKLNKLIKKDGRVLQSALCSPEMMIEGRSRST